MQMMCYYYLVRYVYYKKMLNICFNYVDELDICFNAKESCLLNIGNTFNKKLKNLQLNRLDICWFDNIK